MIKPYRGTSPAIHPTAFIEDSAQIIGNVTIGEQASIWFNATVRGDVHWIKIGNRTNIQDNAVVHVTHKTHPTLLEDDITVGHGVILHGCTIKSRVLVGMGAIVMDGAVVEEDCIIAAGSVVTEGKTIPSGHLAVGTPAKPVRKLTDEEKAGLLKSSENYVGYMQNYLNNME